MQKVDISISIAKKIEESNKIAIGGNKINLLKSTSGDYTLDTSEKTTVSLVENLIKYWLKVDVWHDFL